MVQLEGDAAWAIEGFPLTNDNYVHAVAILKDHFGPSHKVTHEDFNRDDKTNE